MSSRLHVSLTLPLAAVVCASLAHADLKYTKREVKIPMRDGTQLFTALYEPEGATVDLPILLCRTPYSVGPYGEGKLKDTIGPSELFEQSGWIVAYQDVRGCYLSEGQFVDVRPHVPHTPDVQTCKAIDEATDTYDTITWLVANVAKNNGKVGMWGISYPGFYAAAGMVDAHPALAAVSPQAPIGDWWFDDFHHHGALFLPHAFNFLSGFGRARPEPTTSRPGARFQHGTKDGYAFFLRMGPLSNANDKYFHGEIAFWNDLVAHPNYDAFWEERNLLPDLKNVAPAVMTVGGWYDAEDLYGALNVYRAIERQDTDAFNVLVMGPWAHGGWARGDGEALGVARFGAKTSEHYREKLELAFFERTLKGTKTAELAEANVFETGTNRWRAFDAWPPKETVTKTFALQPERALALDGAATRAGFDEFTSDPNEPVPYTEAVAIGMTREYMTDDQRFADRRPDVLAWESAPLAEDLTLAGPIDAELVVSTSGTDSDWIVKLIDVLPDDVKDPEDLPKTMHWSGAQLLVRSEVLRGRFRESYATPEAFVPNEPTRVTVRLQDVLHTFKKGHRVMVQVQCTWFPLVDRNPQTFVPNVFLARPEDFVKATQRVYFGGDKASKLRVGVLPRQG
ncbi:MAG: CocE/NonD family hydrolase [Planctomycetes bacterium]|nr:CocE/NonD family hydrolase [Planctomycetota bacterium]